MASGMKTITYPVKDLTAAKQLYGQGRRRQRHRPVPGPYRRLRGRVGKQASGHRARQGRRLGSLTVMTVWPGCEAIKISP
jgi:hypothetical protein